MNISLISDFSSGMNFFPELKKELQSKIADASVEYFFVPAILDIPLKVKEVSQKSDLVFVFTTFEEFSFAHNLLMEKLVDLELQSGKKIIKAVEEKEIDEDSREEEKNRVKKELIKKYSEQIINCLFHSEKFEPN